MAKKKTNKKKVSKRDDKLKKYIFGGGGLDALSDGAQKGMGALGGITGAISSALPGIGGAVAGGVNMLGQGIASIINMKKEKQRKAGGYYENNDPTIQNGAQNPLGFKNGGEFFELGGDIISQFDALPHSAGGGKVNKLGLPSKSNPIAEIEKKEVKANDYIYSDHLKDINGKTFAKNAKKITSTYKGRDDKISLDTSKIQLAELSKRNDKAKAIKESTKIMKNGGKLPKYGDGGMPRYKKWKKEIANSPANGMMDTTKEQYKLFKKFPYKNKSGSYLDKNTKGETRKLEKHFDRQNKVNNNLDAKYNTSNKDHISNKDFKDSKSSKGFNALTAIGKIGEIGALASQALQKTKQYKPIKNANADKIKSLMSNRKINLDQLRKNINLGDNKLKQEISDNTTSDSVKRANIVAGHINTQKAIADTNIQEQQFNNQYRGEEARQLDALGQFDAGAGERARVSQDRADAAKQQGIMALGKTAGNIGELSSKVNARNKTNTFYSNLLSQKYANFGVSSLDDFTKEGQDIIKYKLENGEELTDDLIKKYRKIAV